MWPFSKKPEAPPAPSLNQQRIEAMERALPLGMEFDYLGRRLRVTHHSIMRMCYHHVRVVPKLCVDYADNTGVIRQLEFSYHEARQLAEELQTAGRPGAWP